MNRPYTQDFRDTKFSIKLTSVSILGGGTKMLAGAILSVCPRPDKSRQGYLRIGTKTFRFDPINKNFLVKVFVHLFQKVARIQRRVALVARRNGRKLPTPSADDKTSLHRPRNPVSKERFFVLISMCIWDFSMLFWGKKGGAKKYQKNSQKSFQNSLTSLFLYDILILEYYRSFVS